jgi:hypothetical protein
MCLALNHFQPHHLGDKRPMAWQRIPQRMALQSTMAVYMAQSLTMNQVVHTQLLETQQPLNTTM